MDGISETIEDLLWYRNEDENYLSRYIFDYF